MSSSQNLESLLISRTSTKLCKFSWELSIRPMIDTQILIFINLKWFWVVFLTLIFTNICPNPLLVEVFGRWSTITAWRTTHFWNTNSMSWKCNVGNKTLLSNSPFRTKYSSFQIMNTKSVSLQMESGPLTILLTLRMTTTKRRFHSRLILLSHMHSFHPDVWITLTKIGIWDVLTGKRPFLISIQSV